MIVYKRYIEQNQNILMKVIKGTFALANEDTHDYKNTNNFAECLFLGF